MCGQQNEYFVSVHGRNVRFWKQLRQYVHDLTRFSLALVVTAANDQFVPCDGSIMTCSKDCLPNYYSATQAASCTACPSQSTAASGSSTCTCNAGYQSSGSGSTLACTGTPQSASLPTDVTVTELQRNRFCFASAMPVFSLLGKHIQCVRWRDYVRELPDRKH